MPPSNTKNQYRANQYCSLHNLYKDFEGEQTPGIAFHILVSFTF